MLVVEVDVDGVVDEFGFARAVLTVALRDCGESVPPRSTLPPSPRSSTCCVSRSPIPNIPPCREYVEPKRLRYCLLPLIHRSVGIGRVWVSAEKVS